MDYTKASWELVKNSINESIEEGKAEIKKELLEECNAKCIEYEVNANVIKVVPIEDIIAMLEEK